MKWTEKLIFRLCTGQAASSLVLWHSTTGKGRGGGSLGSSLLIKYLHHPTKGQQQNCREHNSDSHPLISIFLMHILQYVQVSLRGIINILVSWENQAICSGWKLCGSIQMDQHILLSSHHILSRLVDFHVF